MRRGGMAHLDRHAVGDRERHDVGQIVLALRVVVASGRASQPASCARGAAMMPVFTSRIARSSALASFSSTMRATRPPRVADDAAVALRIVELPA